jgi:hypothetical protein
MNKNPKGYPSHKGWNKDKVFKSQLEAFYRYLLEEKATCSMAERELSIPQKNLCRYKRTLEKADRLWAVCKDVCKVTGFKAWYLTTNPENAPQTNQLRLFD